jgi:phosphatidylserine/phosphatidylglycerophosphate/cardiolipin synthase-like enzyme
MYKLKTSGNVLGVYFSLGTTPSKDPEMSCAQAIVDLFDATKKTALVSIYSLSEASIINSMIKAHKRGVTVIVVADYLQSKGKNMNQYLSKLDKAGIEIHIATKQKACMHNKVGIFDSRIIATGSFNWTSNGTRRNDENLIVIEGDEVAALYEKYVFERVIVNESLVNKYNLSK